MSPKFLLHFLKINFWSYFEVVHGLTHLNVQLNQPIREQKEQQTEIKIDFQKEKNLENTKIPDRWSPFSFVGGE